MNLHKKIDLLFICLESLSFYTNDISTINHYTVSTCLDILNIRHSNNLRKTYKLNYFSNQQVLQCIYFIYMLIQATELNKVAINILKNQNNSLNNIKIAQYLRKYIYIYTSTQSYYYLNSYYNNLFIKEIATTNLYIISQIKQLQDLYLLIKYLYR